MLLAQRSGSNWIKMKIGDEKKIEVQKQKKMIVYLYIIQLVQCPQFFKCRHKIHKIASARAKFEGKTMCEIRAKGQMGKRAKGQKGKRAKGQKSKRAKGQKGKRAKG